MTAYLVLYSIPLDPPRHTSSSCTPQVSIVLPLTLIPDSSDLLACERDTLWTCCYPCICLPKGQLVVTKSGCTILTTAEVADPSPIATFLQRNFALCEEFEGDGVASFAITLAGCIRSAHKLVRGTSPSQEMHC